MQYEGQICRGPMERASFMLPVAVGCRYNRCSFCTLFKHLAYRELPLDQIEAELRRVAALGGNPKTVFLGDGNAFGLATDRLLWILEQIHRYFPGCKAVHMDATVTDIAQKSDAALRRLAEEGVRHLYLGIESGLDDLLRQMQKDHTLAEAYRQIDRLHRAGLLYDAHIMTGIAGRGRGMENAEATAAFFNRTRPARIINFSLFLHRRAPLARMIEEGRFVPADERENLQEDIQLLRALELDGVVYDSFHDRVGLRVRGTLPEDREKMVGRLAERLADTPEALFAWVP